MTELEMRPGDQKDVRRLAIQTGTTGDEPADRKMEARKDQMLVKLMTSENEKSHGSMMLRIGAIAFGLGTLIYTGLGKYSSLYFALQPATCR